MIYLIIINVGKLNYSFLLIICYVKEQNKLCCIIISYCELKLK